MFEKRAEVGRYVASKRGTALTPGGDIQQVHDGKQDGPKRWSAKRKRRNLVTVILNIIKKQQSNKLHSRNGFKKQTVKDLIIGQSQRA